MKSKIFRLNQVLPCIPNNRQSRDETCERAYVFHRLSVWSILYKSAAIFWIHWQCHFDTVSWKMWFNFLFNPNKQQSFTIVWILTIYHITNIRSPIKSNIKQGNKNISWQWPWKIYFHLSQAISLIYVKPSWYNYVSFITSGLSKGLC